MNDEANYTSETSRPKRGRSFTSNGTSMSRQRNRSKDSVRFKIDEIDKKISKIETHLSQKDFTEQAPSTIMERTIEETIPHRGMTTEGQGLCSPGLLRTATHDLKIIDERDEQSRKIDLDKEAQLF